ncbi:MAG: RloB domain-containing protein [Alphaproteobacteria bacterium]|nr:RloB domain-containing protein [Alphaproteobacteria bacterium]
MARIPNKKVLKYLPKKLYHFICEDEKSMLYYLQGFKSEYAVRCKIAINIEQATEGTSANKVQNSALRVHRKLNNNPIYKQVGFQVIACFDKDKNDIHDIYRIIQTNNKTSTMGTIYTNPCYEYWLLLHIEKTNREFNSSSECTEVCCQKIKRKYHKEFSSQTLKKEKHIFSFIGKNIQNAIQNAKQLHLTDYNATYTNAHVLFEELLNRENNTTL